jgi:hypothetical protein
MEKGSVQSLSRGAEGWRSYPDSTSCSASSLESWNSHKAAWNHVRSSSVAVSMTTSSYKSSSSSDGLQSYAAVRVSFLSLHLCC